ncbi:MAG: hypothetical protein KGJ56_00880 [Gammaproteobacteria bacterium]|nr:hypothetical protein [Gammaproteobacteria bacterium]
MNTRRGLLRRLGRASQGPGGRRLLLLLAAIVLLVQTGFPAHEDSHPLGSPNTQCQYCVLGGHLFSVPNTAIEAPAPPLHAEIPLPALVTVHVPPFPRTRFSRGPPAEIIA